MPAPLSNLQAIEAIEAEQYASALAALMGRRNRTNRLPRCSASGEGSGLCQSVNRRGSHSPTVSENDAQVSIPEGGPVEP